MAKTTRTTSCFRVASAGGTPPFTAAGPDVWLAYSDDLVTWREEDMTPIISGETWKVDDGLTLTIGPYRAVWLAPGHPA